MIRRIFISIALTISATAAASAQPSERQSQLLANNCLQCHARPGVGAPLAGVADDWKPRLAKGEDAMLRNVVQGLRGMPPLGYCAACSEEDFRVLIRMLDGSDRAP